MTQLLRSPWAEQFDRLIAQARTSLVLCAPYVGRGPCGRVIQRIKATGGEGFGVTILTDLSRDNMLSGATDVSALADVASAHAGTVIRFLPSLHAKVYVADETCAIVTSANLTDNGFLRNFEYGAYFADPALVRAIKGDVLDYAALGSPIDRGQLETFVTVVAELREMRQAAERSLRSRIRREFDRRLGEVDDDILRARAAGRTAHAIFADSMLHLLRNGPLTTVQMHQAIKRIHPDLCDDSVDRVINGQHFGKKWKHGVRTAQVSLRRRGDIKLEAGEWRLTQ